MKFLRFVYQVLDRFFVVFGAFLGSQIPQYLQQYTQRLAGHVAELDFQIAKLKKIAAMSGKTLDQYIHKFEQNTDPDFVRQGEFMDGIVIRWQELNQALSNLTEASVWKHPFVFLKEMDYSIARNTYESFQPGLNLTTEGFLYACLGILMGYSFYHLLIKGTVAIWSWIRLRTGS
ncbi:MAG: DUF2937 family protein [Candidatus Protochlamydia sp.]|nr:DUF2937 family protein [Candidatus Protochlamydia sp.]